MIVLGVLHIRLKTQLQLVVYLLSCETHGLQGATNADHTVKVDWTNIVDTKINTMYVSIHPLYTVVIQL